MEGWISESPEAYRNPSSSHFHRASSSISNSESPAARASSSGTEWMAWRDAARSAARIASKFRLTESEGTPEMNRCPANR